MSLEIAYTKNQPVAFTGELFGKSPFQSDVKL
jgi:hypothetical protein